MSATLEQLMYQAAEELGLDPDDARAGILMSMAMHPELRAIARDSSLFKQGAERHVIELIKKLHRLAPGIKHKMRDELVKRRVPPNNN